MGKATAQIYSIEGQDPYAYVRDIADEYTGDFIDEEIRQSEVYSSYRYMGKSGQRIGDIAGLTVPTYTKHEIEVVLTPKACTRVKPLHCMLQFSSALAVV
ncbi:hypothetical protein QFC21_004246 [Naganishia friedmannii]|uniref:Uncharacterized protein n=1 Tax=Naganishia friedmannii TaxID=89922 RepID=A0ACC2VHN8_9TREE|nr:hypothetical protein QFC21_004246 [Naganishia friedmannii]